MNGGFGTGGHGIGSTPLESITRASSCPSPAVFISAARTSA